MKFAFVIPWYGVNIPGGAEAEARRTAEHLHRAGVPVEVLTTCVRDFRADWSVNHHRPGDLRRKWRDGAALSGAQTQSGRI